MRFINYLFAILTFPFYFAMMLIVGVGCGLLKGWQLTCNVFDYIVGNDNSML